MGQFSESKSIKIWWKLLNIFGGHVFAFFSITKSLKSLDIDIYFGSQYELGASADSSNRFTNMHCK